MTSGREPLALGLSPEVRRELAARSGMARLGLMLDHPDIVEALPADELFHAINEVGLADARQVVELASPEQFRTFLDLAAWRGDAFEPGRVLPWLRAARPSSSAGEREEKRWRDKLAALDLELLSLVLLDGLRIHDLEEDPDPELRGGRFARTAEGRFIVEFVPDGADYLVLRRLVDDLYARDPFEAGRLLAAVRRELPSELAEAELRLRTGRLADLGYPSLEEALSWFAQTPARRAEKPAGLPDRPAGFWLAAHPGGSLLDRAAALLPSPAKVRFELEAMEAANAVLVADGVDSSDPDEVRSALETARSLLEMGLEEGSTGGDQAAAMLLASTPLKRVFQAGFGRLLKLRWRGERLGSEMAREALTLDPPLGEMLAALRLRRPRYYTGLEAERAEWGSPASGAASTRPFRSLAEARAVATALGEAEDLVALARSLKLAVPVPGGASVATLYLTALANERLGRAFAPDPLAAGDLVRAAAALASLEDPRLQAAGPPGALLATLARNRAAELGPLLAGEPVARGAVAALLVQSS